MLIKCMRLVSNASRGESGDGDMDPGIPRMEKNELHIFKKLTNRIKHLEINQTIANRFIEQLSRLTCFGSMQPVVPEPIFPFRSVSETISKLEGEVLQLDETIGYDTNRERGDNRDLRTGSGIDQCRFFSTELLRQPMPPPPPFCC